MTEEGQPVVIVFLWLLVLIMGISAFIAGRWAAQNSMQKQAIERGFGEYNSTTGVWQWKETP